MSPAIELSDIVCRYGTLTALDNVTFTVDKGELFGIIGPDGAGKSTIYRILSTLLRPTSGTATVCGLDTVKDYARLRKIIGYMPEKFSLYPDLSVSENLNFFASLFGVSAKESHDITAPVFRQLEKFPDRSAGALSGGMKQKLALSCALIHRPEILLLDEPTTGVDAVSRSEFWDMLATLRERGITILVSSSYMDEVSRCDRIAMIDKGRILRTGTPEELENEVKDNLFSAAADNMFLLLSKLRDMEEVRDCYTFGATLHIVSEPGFNPVKVSEKLISEGMKDVTIKPIRGDIEDLFIKLSQNG